MKSTKFWIAVVGALLAVSAGLSVWLLSGKDTGATALIYQNGVCIETIDLSAVTQAVSLRIEWEDGGYNLVSIEPGRICVAEANCPDQVCVRQGWSSNGATPIACLPHRLVIELSGETGADTGIDAAVG